MLRVILALLVLIVSAATASAQDSDIGWVRKAVRSQRMWVDDDRPHTVYIPVKRYVKARYVPAHYHIVRDRPRHYHTDGHRYDRRDDYHERSRNNRCRPYVNVVGQQHVTEDGARREAVDAFMARVRWKYGEQWLDVQNAEDVEYKCARSSVGAAFGGTFTRCELSARPCRPRWDRGDR